jgi:murein DD-endopeptidase MepM/ murein hydrolase activator NlpD
MDSIRRGNLGSTIENSGLSTDQQTMFKQYMIDRAGKNMSGVDMSSSWDMGKSGTGDPEKANPLTGMMQIETSSTKAMAAGENNYIEGINGAAQALGVLNDASAALSASFLGISNAFMKTLTSNNVVQGMTGAANSSLDLISSGIKAILSTTVMGSNPQMGIAGGVAVGVGGVGLAATGVMAATGGAAPNPQGSDVPHGSGEGPMDGAIGTATAGVTSTLSNASSAVIIGGGTVHDVTNSMKVNTGFNGSYIGPDGKKATHKDGIDYGGYGGAPIYAAADGIVTEVHDGEEASSTKKGKTTWSGNSYGNYVRIKHDKKGGGVWYTTYAHMQKNSIIVKQDQPVKAGDLLGKMGRSGEATGVHLHYEVADGTPNNKVNPNKAKDFVGATQTANLDSKTLSLASTISNAVIGLSSGNMEQMKASLATLASSFGLGNVDFSKSPGSSPVGATSSTSTTAGGSTGGGGGTVNTTINVTIPNASPDEAKKFADMVAEYHDNALLSSNMGSF